MSAQAPPPPAAPAPQSPLRIAGAAELRQTLLRVTAFVALASFAAFHWSALLADPPGGRVYGVVLVAAGGALLLVIAGHVAARHTAARVVLCAAIALATIWLAFLAVGLPDELLPLVGGYELRQLVNRGLEALETSPWPYSGGDEEAELTLLLALPATIAPAALLAFWPARRLAPILRAGGLVLLLLLYGAAVTEAEPDAPLIHGAVLLLVIAAWLWLPRLTLPRVGPASAAVLAAGALALPLAAWLDGERPWIDHESWRLATVERGSTETFDWNHSYGPIEWPRDGRVVLEVRSRSAHYWKVQTLNHFDGRRWLHTGATGAPVLVSPASAHDEWDARIGFTIRSLRTSVLASAGMTYEVDVPNHVAVVRDGSPRVLDGPLEQGARYTVSTYAPDPDAAQMRAAPAPRGVALSAYTLVRLPPEAPADGRASGRRDADAAAGRDVSLPLWASETEAGAAAERRVLGSPYRRTYRLARRITAGAPTLYDAVKRVEAHLQDTYDYSEDPPDRRLPLDAFLFDDRRGYCQQFSGAMALMLRMNGIPARVAAGFAPGVRDAGGGRFRVRDLDAHSWVEVYFHGIGWVPFDPTPSAAPAESQSGGRDATSAARGDARDTGGGDARDTDPAAAAPGPHRDGGGGSTLPLLLGALAALLLLVAATFWLTGRRHRGDDQELRELREALERLGYRVPPKTTLLGLERTLARAAGPGAARYVRAVRERRFAPPGGPARRDLDRRALRRGLTRPLGLVARLRGWWVLPPRLPGRRFRAS